MAALRDIARDFAAEIRDGIGWTIVYRIGRSWNALTIWSNIWNGEWETDDLNDAIGILKADPDVPQALKQVFPQCPKPLEPHWQCAEGSSENHFPLPANVHAAF